jgi:hypothetical protein
MPESSDIENVLPPKVKNSGVSRKIIPRGDFLQTIHPLMEGGE